VYEWGRGRMTRLTFGGGYTNPLWSADGRYLVFRALSQRARGIWWIRADGTGQPQLLTPSNNLQLPNSFTADGKRLAFNEVSPATGDDIWTVPIETSSSGLRAGKPEPFLQGAFHERAPTFSPDGRWMAYMSNESGRFQTADFERRGSDSGVVTQRARPVLYVIKWPAYGCILSDVRRFVRRGEATRLV
jgi:Tol biopolymer transport system component